MAFLPSPGTSLPVMSPDTGVSDGDAASPVTKDTARASDDWAALLVAKVEDVVALLRDRTVAPVTKIVRYVIFGLVAIFIASLLAVLFAVLLVRVLDNYAFHQRVWASYLIVGGIFAGAGLLLSSLRHPRS